ncbi:efflux RND transporter periplasmic adaptor subunit [Desulfonatronum lacustre]|uniref:efflux RND transporter periplasmic adaptor subunit n=1 Tax=Desulfonatronum lacustre TaxID=66849 RepID=UPI000555150E|nr:efflux RND transporter periplasmic adaptor subunit [Desulfonatronum lacustre]
MLFLRPTIFLCVLLLFTGCAEPEPLYAPGPRPVKTMVVEPPQSQVVRSFSGMARASRDMALSFQVSGVLRELPVQIGQRIRAGELIARLDPTDFELKVMELEAQTVQARAAFTRAKADYERFQTLFEADSVSKSELDQVRAEFETAQAQLAAMGKSLELVRQQFSYTRLTAPMAGTISEVPVENHQTVSSGQPIVVLSTDDDLEFEVGLPDQLIHQVQPGEPAQVIFDVLPNQPYDATVSEVGITPGPVSTFPVKLRLAEPAPQVRPGMIGMARFTFSHANSRPFTLVPVEAVFGLPSGEQAVWLVDPESDTNSGTNSGTVHRQPVIAGRLLPGGLQILDGLLGGEIIVIRGVHRLEQGQKVRLPQNAS